MWDFDDQIQTLFNALDKKDWMLTTAESCTGGMIGSIITETSGSSTYYDRGYITYSNEAKIDMLNVSRETLGEHGAVSAEVAIEMAAGALANSNAQIAVSVTGVAGPAGGTDEKPVGLVYIGIATENGDEVFKNNFKGDRQSVRIQTLQKALDLLIEHVKKS